jgi:hypothetical protein
LFSSPPSTEASAPETDSDASQVHERIRELESLLENGDSESAQCLKSIKTHLTGPEYDSLLSNMDRQIFEFDFEAALSTLDFLKQKLLSY